MKYHLLLIILAFNFHLAQAQVGIGTLTPTSTLAVEGSFATKTVLLGSNTTLDETHHMVVGLFNITITLPDPDNIIGREYIIKANNTGGIIVAPTIGDVIDGSATSITLDSYETLMVKSIGTGFWAIVKDNNTGAEKIDELSDGKTLDNSIFLGTLSGVAATSGTEKNLAIGDGSAINLNGGDNNVIIGELGGTSLTTGSNNVFLGQGAGTNPSTGVTTGSSNILIGNNVQTLGQAVSNELNIGDAIYATGLYGTTANVGIGNANNAPNSTLQVTGSMSLPINTGTTAYTLTDDDYTYLINGADVTLPTAAGRDGRIYIIKNIGSTNQTLHTAPLSGQTIDGETSKGIRSNNRLIGIQSDGSDWWIIMELN